MSKLFSLPISKEVLMGLLTLFLQVTIQAQEETVTDNKGNIIQVRNTRVTTAATAPGGPLQNDIWFDTAANLTKIYDGTAWVVINEDALASKEDSANKSTDVNLADATDSKFPTELAVKTYVDGRVSATADDDWYQQNSSDTATDIDQSIFTNGNVGIGTDLPQRALHIAGGNTVFRLSRSSNTAGMIFDRYSGTINNTLKSYMFGVNASSTGVGEFFFADYDENISGAAFTRIMTFTDGSEVVRFDQYGDGNFSSTNSTYLLGVEADGDIVEVNLSNTAGQTFYEEGTTTAPNDINDNMYTQGNVGIGTPAPASKLHISETIGTVASATAGSLLLEHENDGGTSSIVFKSRLNEGSDFGYIQFTDDGSSNGGTTENGLLEIGIQNDAPGTFQDDIALMPSGQVGIGTRAPSAKLDIESNGVPLKITPSTTTPTGTQAGQIFMGNDGILYGFDGSRNKWLSIDRTLIGWGKNGDAKDEYLRQFNGSKSEFNGWRMIRDATITAISIQNENDDESWVLEIRKNDTTSAIASLSISNIEGGHTNVINVNVNEGDFLQAYINGDKAKNPQALIEIAWRK